MQGGWLIPGEEIFSIIGKFCASANVGGSGSAL